MSNENKCDYTDVHKQEPETDIQRIDQKLRIYYQKNGIQDYCKNGAEIGRFAIWCEDNGFDDDALKDDFNGNAEDSMMIEFDPNFPLKTKVNDSTTRNKKIFRILKNIYEAKEEIDIDDINLHVTVEQMKETRDLYQRHVKTWGSEDGFTQLTDINILYMLTVSRVYPNQNLLLNLIDSCKRDIIAQQVHIKKLNKNKFAETDIINTETDPEDNKLKHWISKRPILQELNKAIKKMANKWDQNELKKLTCSKTDDRTRLDLKMILKTYPKRMGQRLSPMGSRLMNGDLQMVAKYIAASSKFLNQWIEFETKGIGGPPFLFEFIILLKPSVSGDIFKKPDHSAAKVNDESKESSDDDDPEYQGPMNNVIKIEYKEDIIPKPENDIVSCNCEYYKSMIEQDSKDDGFFELVGRKTMVNAFRELRTKLTDTIKSTYPQNHRFNMIIDGRKKMHKHELIVFEPPKGSNKLSDVNIAECYFDLSRQCLIPRKGYIPWDKRTTDDRIELASSDKEQVERLKTQSIDATQAAQGQILTFSYHVWEADAIKCYLLWNGRCHRFYPQDILELLPYLFVKNDANKEFVKSDEAKRLVMEMQQGMRDTKFEEFYRGLNRLHEYEFPKQYYKPIRKYQMENPQQ